MIKSPLNYTGGKYKLLPQLIKIFPKDIDTFIDLFCGGCNVGINSTAEKVIFVDNNKYLINLFKFFQKRSSKHIIKQILNLIEEYNLSNLRQHTYEFYGCDSSDGLAKFNKDKFLKLREDFNSLQRKDSRYFCMFYLLIVYSFNNQIRFNENGDFNLPVGKRDFNLQMEEKLANFVNKIHESKFQFINKDFRKIDFNKLGNNDFVYADPPYLITCASYNENGGWTEKDEKDLLKRLDDLSLRGIKFALSNVIENKGKTNNILIKWLDKNPNYHVIHLNFNYSNSNYHGKKNMRTDEVLIVNYQIGDEMYD